MSSSDFTDMSTNGFDDDDLMSELERALVLRAINSERNNLVHWYGFKGHWRVDGFRPDDPRPAGYFDQPFQLDQVWADQVAALNRFEARLNGCECCFNNADDFEHYHSDVCDPSYVEPVEA